MLSARFSLLLLSVLLFITISTPVRAQSQDMARLIPVSAPTLLDSVRSGAGQATLVNIWATWCRPCKEEMPDLLRLEREYRGRGFRLLLVSADFTRNREQAEQYMANLGVDPPGMIKDQNDMEFINGLDPAWSGTLPFSILFDSTGTRVVSWEGKTSYTSFREAVENLLDKNDEP